MQGQKRDLGTLDLLFSGLINNLLKFYDLRGTAHGRGLARF